MSLSYFIPPEFAAETWVRSRMGDIPDPDDRLVSFLKYDRFRIPKPICPKHFCLRDFELWLPFSDCLARPVLLTRPPPKEPTSLGQGVCFIFTHYDPHTGHAWSRHECWLTDHLEMFTEGHPCLLSHQTVTHQGRMTGQSSRGGFGRETLHGWTRRM